MALKYVGYYCNLYNSSMNHSPEWEIPVECIVVLSQTWQRSPSKSVFMGKNSCKFTSRVQQAALNLFLTIILNNLLVLIGLVLTG